jgi:hypothetical protein
MYVARTQCTNDAWKEGGEICPHGPIMMEPVRGLPLYTRKATVRHLLLPQAGCHRFELWPGSLRRDESDATKGWFHRNVSVRNVPLTLQNGALQKILCFFLDLSSTPDAWLWVQNACVCHLSLKKYFWRLLLPQ